MQARGCAFEFEGPVPRRIQGVGSGGGPHVPLELRAETADEVIKAQDQHLKDVVATGDTAHEQALKEMKGRWKHPIAGMGWYKQVKRDFAALPEG